MGILSGIFRSRDKPKDRTAGSSYSFSLGGTSAGKYVTERSAMQMTAVYCCVKILSEAVASLPLQFYRYTDDGGKEKAVDHPLYFLLHDEPNPKMTSFIFRETLMTHLLLFGNSFAQIIRNGKGEVIALYPLMPDKMKVDRDEHGRIYYEYTVADADDVNGRKGTDKAGKTVKLQAKDVLHIPGLGFDGLVGYSPIAMAKNAIGLAMATEEYGSKFFANGAAPSGVLEHPGTIKDPSKVRESWQATIGGSGNANKIAVLEEGMKYTPISISPEQAQFLETRKFQIDEIARIFRVPPHMIGDLEKSSFNNIERQSLEFVKYTLDVREASDAVLLWYERPADQSDAVQVKRAGYGEGYLKKYGGTAEKPASGGMTNADCPFLVRITAKDLRIRKGAGTDKAWTGKYVPPGTYTIVEVKAGKGSAAGWGRLKSGIGWLSLDFCQRI